MWRRVSCEQPLDTSQSILRLRGNLDQTRGCVLLCHCYGHGDAERESGPYSGTWSRNRFGTSYPSWQRDATGRRPLELWEELSFLHKPPRPWNPLEGRMGFGSRPRVPKFSRHPRASGGTLKIPGRRRRTRASSYPYPQQVSKVNSLWSME